MTLQCDGVKQYIQEQTMIAEIIINGKTTYILDGYFYSIDTLPMDKLFRSLWF